MLLVRDGLAARHVGQRGDKAADVIALDHATRRTVVVQCKHTTTDAKVGTRVIYEVNGTAGPAHGADLAVVATNGGFTRDARTRRPRSASPSSIARRCSSGRNGELRSARSWRWTLCCGHAGTGCVIAADRDLLITERAAGPHTPLAC